MKDKKLTSKPMKSGLHLFTLAGFDVRLDFSWLILAFLVTWTLAVGYFPANYPDFSAGTYWIMGVFGVIGLFLSIVFHELCHSLVGRRYGIPMEGITLFIFGGIANMTDMPPNPKSEFLMAVVGPIFSLALGIGFYCLAQLGYYLQWQDQVTGVIQYLFIINIILGIFNLLPAFPLDGGRLLRATLWWWKQDLKWATDIACKGGAVLGFTLIMLGVLQFLWGAIISGIWLFILGFFLQYISKTSYQNVLIRQVFTDEPVKAYAKTDVVTVDQNVTIDTLMSDYFLQHYHKLYPVVKQNKLVGCISLKDVKALDKEQWSSTKVSDVMRPCSETTVIDADTKVMKALLTMNANNISRMIVTKNNKLYGILTLKDLMNVVSVKLALEES
ncbi:site-2 protease family protein [Legionella yabuuchiae]|uniref:site-2 protease family protein n=1 Tax=Legionella yabuuchiae TaxID=376727 RepID=UPI001054F850|nr:site-2 protease family protein [Legionella yabuuchiae]